VSSLEPPGADSHIARARMAASDGLSVLWILATAGKKYRVKDKSDLWIKFLVEGTMGLSSGACGQICISMCTHLDTRDNVDPAHLTLETPQYRFPFQLHLVCTAQEQHHVITDQRRVQCLVCA